MRALSKASSVARSSGTGCAGRRLRWGVPSCINGQRGVGGVRGIDPLGDLPQAFAQRRDEVRRGGGELERLAIRR